MRNVHFRFPSAAQKRLVPKAWFIILNVQDIKSSTDFLSQYGSVVRAKASSDSQMGLPSISQEL